MIEHDSQLQQFALTHQGHIARVVYTLHGSTMTITHTQVPEAIGGQGIAAQLTKAALEHARSAGLEVVPACSYTQSYLKRHPQFQDLVQD